MARHLLTTVALLLIAIPAVLAQVPAQETDEDTYPTIERKHQVGIRLGGWINAGDDIPEFAVDTTSLAILETSIKCGSFYFEAYGAYAVLPSTFLELSIGIVNRGSVTIQDGQFQDIGNLVLYPILLQLKWYPFAPLRSNNSRSGPIESRHPLSTKERERTRRPWFSTQSRQPNRAISTRSSSIRPDGSTPGRI